MVDKSEKFRWLVRLGYAARGLVYIVLGYLALTTASRAEGGGTAVFDTLHDVPLGTALLWLMAVGLLAYAIFKFLSAAADVQHHGTSAGGLAKRTGDAASAVAHAVLAFGAFQYASGSDAPPSGPSGGEQAAGMILAMPLGEALVGLVGLGFLAGAVMQARSALTGRFMARVSPAAPAAVRPVGRLGYAARAVVFVIVGWSLVQSAWLDSEAPVKDLGEAIGALHGGGGPLYTAVALGLLLFGLFSLVVSRYRIIPDLHASDLKPGLR